ncbi:hypothetical protein [Paenibacillus xylanexedens]|uniref:hypothetical protein n=1 Tax=Paenibacillus xylanexedens TaxID=528191 RepID=UPI0037C7D138
MKVYSGGWSDWISYEGNAVATDMNNVKEPALCAGSLCSAWVVTLSVNSALRYSETIKK